MEISKTFIVNVPAKTAWQFFTDPQRVAPCLPGAAITGQIDERTHAGTVTVKVGPVTSTYEGTLRFESIDPLARTAEIVAVGQDVKGKGGADMRMKSRLVERAPSETEVTITSNLNIVGTLAQVGRGIIQDESDQVFDRFVGAVRAELESPIPVSTISYAPTDPASMTVAGGVAVLSKPATSAPPIEVLSTASGTGRAAGRTARRPLVWAGLLIMLLLVYLVFGR
jgi:carbon monoxide dehydrogenase subunit G